MVAKLIGKINRQEQYPQYCKPLLMSKRNRRKQYNDFFLFLTRNSIRVTDALTHPDRHSKREDDDI